MRSRNYEPFYDESLDSYSSDIESVNQLPLPKVTEDEESERFVDMKVLADLNKQGRKSLNVSRNEISIDIKVGKGCNGLRNESRSNIWKVFSKQRKEGNNIVKDVRNRIGNSYAARKQRYITSLQISVGIENTKPNPQKSRPASVIPWKSFHQQQF